MMSRTVTVAGGTAVMAASMVSVVLGSGPAAGEVDWQTLKGKHFVVHTTGETPRAVARQVLRRAESDYRRIGDRIGYTRYSKFWIGEDRVKIFVFPDREAYVTTTGQPAWSAGFADRDVQLFRSRMIVTFVQEEDFFDGLLPHEVSHLVLHDFLGGGRTVPVWFDEGVAQLMEDAKPAVADRIVRGLAAEGRTIPLRQLTERDIRDEQDPQHVKIFYAQSLSVVDFLIGRYGSDAFGRLCRAMRDGETFEQALHRTYPNRIDSLEDLERKWLDHLGR